MSKINVQVNGKHQTVLLVFLQSLTTVLKQQQKKCDEIYQEAIEANYSHEQMTPLNSILGNTEIILDDFKKLVAGSDGVSKKMSDGVLMKIVESIRFLQAIQ